jgi:hypothetical protein
VALPVMTVRREGTEKETFPEEAPDPPAPPMEKEAVAEMEASPEVLEALVTEPAEPPPPPTD